MNKELEYIKSKEWFNNSYLHKFYEERGTPTTFRPIRAIYWAKTGFFLFIQFPSGNDSIKFYSYFLFEKTRDWANYLDLKIKTAEVEQKQLETLLTHKSNIVRRFAASKIKEENEN